MNLENLLREIAPAQALQIKPTHYTDGKLELTAPLHLNRNDKGTGFAGSIASMLVLAGWALITLGLEEAGLDAEVMVVKSETGYSGPVQAELKAEASVDPTEMARVFQEVEKRGRSRITVQSRMEESAHMTASYAIIFKA